MSDAQSSLARQQQSIQTNNQQLQQQMNAHQVNPDLQKAVAEANKKLLARRRVLDWVSRSQSEERILFSDILAGLGRRHVEGLWLSTVAIDQKGGSMQLQGNTLQPELVAVFLSALKQEKAFTGTEFRKIKIEEQTPQSDAMSFLLTTEAPDNDKVAANRRKPRQ
jgi:Tfp pilus assembly protein PilN